MAESETRVEQAPVKAQPNTMTATSAAMGQLPKWFWVALIGVALIVGVTFMIGHKSRMSPFDRALFATVQIGIGVAVMLVGQFIGLIRIAPDDSSLGFKDALFPFRLYALAIKHLPSTRLTVYFGAWGLAAIISAAVCIGGVEHWLTYLPHNQKNQAKNNNPNPNGIPKGVPNFSDVQKKITEQRDR